MNIKPKKCEACGKDFLPAYNVTKAYWKRRKYCSNECRFTGTKGKRRVTFGRERTTLESRFWPKVNKDGPIQPHCPEIGPCWVWIGAITNDGYGHLGSTSHRKGVKVHRLSYELHHGDIPASLCVLHRCDNPPCVNPDHLFLGTRADNNADRESKGRGSDKHGEANPRSKLTEEDVKVIRQLRKEGLSQQAIATRFGVVQVTISKILLGQLWSSLEV